MFKPALVSLDKGDFLAKYNYLILFFKKARIYVKPLTSGHSEDSILHWLHNFLLR
jgi:hypothetical protein